MATSGLPVKSIEHCTCWENVQFAFLCMSQEQFEIFLLTDDEIKKQQNQKETAIDNTPKPKQKIVTGDKYLDEIEKAFEKGNIEDIDALLKNL